MSYCRRTAHACAVWVRSVCIYCPFMPEFQVFHNGTIVTHSGVIPSGMRVARGGRLDISPGFVDIHVHGGAGSDFMDATPVDIETVFRYHSAHGTTSLCPTTATAPLNEILATLDALARYRS